jgi:PilZ domain-containing protein
MGSLDQRDKRKTKRVLVSLPLRVRGVNREGIKFEEITRSIDVSPEGALFLLKQPLNTGTRLELSLPLPRSMQKTGAPKPVYETMGFVLRVTLGDDPGTFKIAVRFRNAFAKHYRV